MKKKSIWLRQFVLLAVCAFTVSSYGQGKKIFGAGKAFKGKPYTGISSRAAIGGAAVFAAGAAAWRNSQTHSSTQSVRIPEGVTVSGSLPHDRLVGIIPDFKGIVGINPKLKESLRRMREEARLKEIELRKFKDSYKKTCEGIKQGRVLRDTLYWIRLYNQAMIFKEDSIAKDCLTRFLSYNPSVPIIVAADSLIPSNDRYAPAIPAISTELKFYEYWAKPDSATITSSDFATLATLGEKRNPKEFYVNLARGMRDCLNGNYKSASDIFMNLFEYEIDFPSFKPEYKRLLSNITAYTLDCAGRYADMLAFFEKWEDMMLAPTVSRR